MYAADRLLADAAYLAHHLHWSFDNVLDMEHPDREFIISQVEGWFAPPEGAEEYDHHETYVEPAPPAPHPDWVAAQSMPTVSPTETRPAYQSGGSDGPEAELAAMRREQPTGLDLQGITPEQLAELGGG